MNILSKNCSIWICQGEGPKRRSVGVVMGDMERVGVTEEGGMKADDPLWRTLRGATKRRTNNVCTGYYPFK